MVQLLQNRLPVGYLHRMALPKDLRVGLPWEFGRLVQNPLSRGEAPDPDVATTLHGQWVELRGGELPVPVSVRIDRTEDGRFMVTGLLIGLRSRQELTWQTLRDIKPATILSYIFSGFDPKQPAKQVVEESQRYVVEVDGATFDVDAWQRGEDFDDVPVVTAEELSESLRVQAAYSLWQNSSSPAPLTAPPRPTKTRDGTDLQEVSDVWLKHKASAPWRATTATAKELGVSRATVLRRLKEAEDMGLIPSGSVAANKSRRATES